MLPTRPIRLMLSAALILSAAACSTQPSTTPTVTNQPPDACLNLCAKLAKPASEDPNVVYDWTVGAVNSYGECARAHADCAAWVLKKDAPAVPAKRWWQW